jgi:hypothetical protein
VRRRWWQTLPALFVVGVLPVPFGLYFLSFIAIGMLLIDPTRESEVKGGGLVLLFWWAYSFREGDTSPYFGGFLLLVAAALLARGALKRRRTSRPDAWVPALGAVFAAVMAVLAVVPYGYRSAEIGRDDALARTVAERRAHPWKGIDATSYLVDRGRLRFVHTPVWYVVLYERNPSVAETVDKQPCFARREVWRVDALDGSVGRATYDEARVGHDPCLPLRAGTSKDLHAVPG